MRPQGYYRYPIINNDDVVFVCEGDLWHHNMLHGTTVRLTFNRGEIKTPVFSPDGQTLAFASSDEGCFDIYTMPLSGGEMTRHTYLGDQVTVHQWNQDGIYFSSTHAQAFRGVQNLYRLDLRQPLPQHFPLGPVSHFNQSLDKISVIQRHGSKDSSYWKRYRGGTAGDLWIQHHEQATYSRLLTLAGNLSRPFVINNLIYFIADHEGIGNVYRCDLDGQHLTSVTQQSKYYARGLHTDGQKIIYHAGGDLYVRNLNNDSEKKLDINYASDRSARKRKFFSFPKYLESYHLHPQGHHLTLLSRGKACFMHNWDGPVIPITPDNTGRSRFPSWLNNGKHLVCIADFGGEETLAVYDAQSGDLLRRPEGNLNIGRTLGLWIHPKEDLIALVNHRHEIIIVNLTDWSLNFIDRSLHGVPGGCDWSPDGRYLAYSTSINRKQQAIKLHDLETKTTHQITKPLLKDQYPTFDPEGKYLYFLSWRHFEPTYDSLHFELGFNHGCKPYAIMLQHDAPSPFRKMPESLLVEPKSDDEEAAAGPSKKPTKKQKALDERKFAIDLEGIQERLQPFPIESGEYSTLQAAKGKIFYISHDLDVFDDHHEPGEEDRTGAHLEVFDFESLKDDTVALDVDAFHLSMDKEHLVYRKGIKLRVTRVGEKPDEEQGFSKKSGWINLNRPSLMVDPVIEWQQIYKEAWRLQRDHFWVEDMAHLDWQGVYDRYWPLLERVSTREEFNDLLWEMQGELATSHAYVSGGDLKPNPNWRVGSLAADFEWDTIRQAYKVTAIAKGDVWNPYLSSPLLTPGSQIKVGDYILAIDKIPLSHHMTPQRTLLQKAGRDVELTVQGVKDKTSRCVNVKTLWTQAPVLYRDWVETNRAHVHEQSKGRVGYIHIPDMSPAGYAEFHRSFLQEVDKEGLIIDVRYNGGGHVSQLLLEKLARRRLGYDVTRWMGEVPYPEDAPLGPMVCITNEYAGSDGDLFSHSFKLMKLGPLIGKRTWGGVIGMWDRYHLVDGGVTTQPEFSFWFKEGGWSLENYGTDPDIEIEFKPDDYWNNHDPQMSKALELIEAQITTHQEQRPDMDTKPVLKLP